MAFLRSAGRRGKGIVKSALPEMLPASENKIQVHPQESGGNIVARSVHGRDGFFELPVLFSILTAGKLGVGHFVKRKAGDGTPRL